MLSIHHPNLSMFESLDHIYVVHKGRSFFQCDTADVRQYFAVRGLPVPEAENPADWILTVTQTHDVQDLEDRGFFSTHKAGAAERDSATEDWDSSSEKDYQMVDLDASIHSADDVPGYVSTVSCSQLVKEDPTSTWMETKNLAMREFRRAKRDKDAMVFRIGIAIVGSVVFAVVFNGVADGTIESASDFR